MLLGEILVTRFDMKQSDLDRALELQKELGGYVGQILINLGAITEYHLVQALSIQLNIPVYEKDDATAISESLIAQMEERMDVRYLIRKNFIPLEPINGTVTFLTSDPLNSPVIDYITRRIDRRVRLMLATEQTIGDMARPFRDTSKEFVSLALDGSPEMLKEMAAEAPVIKFLNSLLSNAVDLRASDIHIEPSEARHRLKFRIDGVLHQIDTMDEKLYLAVVSRIKLLAGLDIAEKRLPQDGKFSTKIAATLIDVRVSSIPFAIGEGVVMRLLYRERLSFDITRLGVERDLLPIISELVNMPYGILLVTGPTGSGKTTSLYSMLSTLDSREKKIVTVEDPVEYRIDGINQIQVKSDIGLSFAASLRSILRHDPDVIMIGEIRDPETAEIAVQSALTGHLVLSTLHTNDAPSSLFRLVEMGLEEYLLNASIIGVIAQRIVRRNCEVCSEETAITRGEAKKYGLEELYHRYKDVLHLNWTLRKGKGCRKCAGTGYRGMVAIFEIFKYTDVLKEVFRQNRSVDVLRAKLVQDTSFRTLRQDGMLKVIKGITTIEEVLRVT